MVDDLLQAAVSPYTIVPAIRHGEDARLPVLTRLPFFCSEKFAFFQAADLYSGYSVAKGALRDDL